MAGGFPGGSPPPVPVTRSNNNSCLLWGLAGCGVLILLFIGLAAFGGMWLRQNKGTKNLISSITNAPACGQNLPLLREALENYRKDHKGTYPEKLADLVPKYANDALTDSCGGSLTRIGDQIQFTPPKSTAPKDMVVLSVNMGDSSFVPTQVQTLYVRLLNDGRVVMDQVSRTELSRHRTSP
jgi:hypothetical protein